MKSKRILAGFSTFGLLATGTFVSSTNAGPAQAAETFANTNSSGTTLTPNPAYQGTDFEGWGTSLVWFANATGDYPEELRQELYDYLFSEEGMNLNVARYNIGGGNASDVPNYFRAGADVEGWWKINLDDESQPLSTYADRDEYLANWDADNPDSYNWDADLTQRWWVEELANNRDDMVWEAFSNSPPYFMTNSGFTTGNFTSSAEQMKTTNDAPTKFAKYLTNVTSFLEDKYGIEFNSIDPFNEPCNGYWGTSIKAGETWPAVGGKVQEGAQICPGTADGQQQSIIAKLASALDDSSTNAIISANDETNPSQFNKAWTQYDTETKSSVSQINVHTYSTGGIQQTRDIAKANNTTLWMSETGGNYVDSTGFDPLSISGGINFSQRVISDITQLEPDAYVFWQEIEDYYNMEKVEKLNWGSVFIDFDCNDDGYSLRRLADAGWETGDAYPETAKCEIVTNSKYNALRNFTHYIPQGSNFIATNDSNTLSAITPDGLSIVHVNAASAAETVTLDLSLFSDIQAGATVTPVITTEAESTTDLTSNSLVEGTPVAVDPVSKSATLTIPAQSVVTFVVDGVSGVTDDATLVPTDEPVQLIGKQSSKALSGGSSASAVLANVATTSADVTSQQWTFHRVGDAEQYSASQEYTIENGNGQYLGATSDGTDLREISAEEAAANSETTWILNTTEGETISILNQSLEQVLDVNGQSSAVGAQVGTYNSNGGTNQIWSVRNIELKGIVGQSVHTGVGIAPELPTTATPIYSWGNGPSVSVEWDLPEGYWNNAGTITVSGSGTDIYGNAFDDAKLTIDVGPFTQTDSASITVAKGSSLATVQSLAPDQVAAHTKGSTASFSVPVVWDWAELTDSDLASTGMVTVTGTVSAEDNFGTELQAKLNIYVTEGTATNLLRLDGVSATASYTESGYSPSGTHNGMTTDKAWSTWGSGRTYTSDYITYTLPDAYTANTAKIYFYRDGSNTSWANSVQVQYLVDETWTESPAGTVAVSQTQAGQIVTEVDLSGITSDQFRVIFNATNYLTVSEVELYGDLAGPASDSALSALRINGLDIDSFDPQQLEYAVNSLGSAYPTISAVSRDQAATVVVTQANDTNGAIATISVQSADGNYSSTYKVTINRQVVINQITLSQAETVKTGEALEATATVDPTDAALTYQWLADGTEIGGATAATYTPQNSDINKKLSVKVWATKTDWVDAETLVSDEILVKALSADNSLLDLRLDGVSISGFSPNKTQYDLAYSGKAMPTVTAVATDPAATLSIEQFNNAGKATVTVTAEDGTSQIYTINLDFTEESTTETPTDSTGTPSTKPTATSPQNSSSSGTSSTSLAATGATAVTVALIAVLAMIAGVGLFGLRRKTD